MADIHESHSSALQSELNARAKAKDEVKHDPSNGRFSSGSGSSGGGSDPEEAAFAALMKKAGGKQSPEEEAFEALMGKAHAAKDEIKHDPSSGRFTGSGGSSGGSSKPKSNALPIAKGTGFFGEKTGFQKAAERARGGLSEETHKGLSSNNPHEKRRAQAEAQKQGVPMRFNRSTGQSEVDTRTRRG